MVWLAEVVHDGRWDGDCHGSECKSGRRIFFKSIRTPAKGGSFFGESVIQRAPVFRRAPCLPPRNNGSTLECEIGLRAERKAVELLKTIEKTKQRRNMGLSGFRWFEADCSVALAN